MRIKNSFDADDAAMCRAHSDRIAGDHVDRLYLSQCTGTEADHARWLSVRAFELGVHMPADLPLPPSYYEDLAGWLRSLEQTPAKTNPAAELPASEFSVCVRQYVSGFGYEFHVGEVLPFGRIENVVAFANWPPCDKDGWITHIPTPTSTCPVPDGVTFETLRRDGHHIAMFGMTPPVAWELGWRERREPSPGDVVAWRPVRSAA